MRDIFVKALYDYDATEKGALSFIQGDIIQVYSRLASGWWAGQLEGKRGWY